MRQYDNKIISAVAIDAHKKKWSQQKSVLVGGCFDILHFGHIIFLEKAKQVGDFLIVALESDAFIQKRKQRDPIHTQDQRAYMLASLQSVDIVIRLAYMQGHEKYFDITKQIHPQIIAVTEGDHKVKYKYEHTKQIGAQVQVVSPLVTPFSTSSIIPYASILSDWYSRSC